MTGLIGVVRGSPSSPHSCLLHPSSPPFRDQMFSFTGHFVANHATHFTNNERSFRPKCKKILNKQKSSICVFQCWLNCQLASFEALPSLDKNHRRSNAIVERGPFFASCRTKTISVKIQLFPVCHIRRTSPIQEFSWSQNGAFWETENRLRRTSLTDAICILKRRNSCVSLAIQKSNPNCNWKNKHEK